MKVTVNGDSREVPPDTTVGGLLAELGLRPEVVAVERNRELVPRAQQAQAQLAEGDELEIVTLVGGG